MKQAVAHHRVFFDENYSRTRRLVRSLIRNPQNPQSPKLPLYKEILQILPKLRKNGERFALLPFLSIFAGETTNKGRIIPTLTLWT